MTTEIPTIQDASATLQALLGNSSKIIGGIEKKSSLGNTFKTNRTIYMDKSAKLSNGREILIKSKGINKFQNRERVMKSIPGWKVSNKNQIEIEIEIENENVIIDKDDQNSFAPGVNMSLLWEKIRIADKVEIETAKTLKETEYLLSDISKQQQQLLPKKRVNTLWTEKYRPKKFLDLIGNEKTNSFVLKWLNDWKYAVNGGSLENIEESDVNYDPLRRPRRKILIVHGSPGIGKTTVAHCVAKQLGYELHEINSSDERSGAVVRDKVTNALKMRSLSGKNVCLVLDEIDGASGTDGGFIKMLIEIISKDKKATDEWNSTGHLKNYKKSHFIKRPIIAVCNDIYAPSLDQLKPFCEIVHFKKTSNIFIKKRLGKICQKENIAVDEKLLDDLVVSMDGDIRNCINFLQFNSSDLQGRMKDCQIAWFQILRDIFTRSSKITKNAQFLKLFNEMIGSPGQLDKINNGCFNGMLLSENCNLNKIDKTYDWLYFYDEIYQHSTMLERDDLNGYNTATPLKFYQLFNETNSGETNKHLSFRSQELFDVKKQIREMYSKLEYKNLHTNLKNFILFEGNLLHRILVPSEIPIKKFEINKNKLDRICELLRNIELRFENVYTRQKDRFLNVNVEKFRPDLNLALLKSTILNNKNEHVNVKVQVQVQTQVQDQDQDLEILFSPYIKINKQTMAKYYQGEREKKANLDNLKKRSTSDLPLSGPETKKRLALTSVDYFKQQYNNFSTQLQSQSQKGKTNNEDSKIYNSKGVMSENQNRIWVKFHEGFSNAVRKETTWSNLFE
ncbi:Ctf18 protein [Martiniozyma asiatica (nom. inval.)]|nr:Ctf18 protein [Martiniozyma asiatica]